MRRVEMMLAAIERDMVRLREVVHGASMVEIEHAEPPEPCDQRRSNRVFTIVERVKGRLERVSIECDREAAKTW